MAYTERFVDALTFAARVHEQQTRKGSGVPYVTHVIGVAALVGDHGGTEAQVIGGLLHDAIEDGVEDNPDIASEIAARFGEEVLHIVEACSDTEVHPKPPWEERKRAYIDSVQAKADDDPALLVALADKVYNARTLLRDHDLVGDDLWDRFRATHAQTLWYYRALADAFLAKQWPTPTQRHLAGELERVVRALEARASGQQEEEE